MEIPAGLIEFMTGLRITDPLIEILAIKLYEHDTDLGRWPPVHRPGWLQLPERDREVYRVLARGGGHVCEEVKRTELPEPRTELPKPFCQAATSSNKEQEGADSSKIRLKNP